MPSYVQRHDPGLFILALRSRSGTVDTRGRMVYAHGKHVFRGQCSSSDEFQKRC